MVPVILTGLWLYGFFHPAIPLTEHAAPLYKLIVTSLSGFPLLLTALSFLLILCEAVLINHIIEQNEIINTKSFLPASVYIILMSLQPEMFSLHPIVIANLFLLLAIHRLMQTHRKETAFSNVFDAGLYISLATLFFVPSAVFLLILWICLLVIRPFIWREWVISFIGLLLPWIYVVAYYFWKDKLDMLEYDALYYTIIAPSKSFSALRFSAAEYFQAAVLFVFLILTAGRLFHDVSSGAVRTRNNLIVMIYFFFLSLVSIFLAPSYSIHYLSFLAIPVSIFFSGYLLFSKKQLIAEIIFLLLIISVFVNQIFYN